MAEEPTLEDRLRLAALVERDRDRLGKSIVEVYGQHETKDRFVAGGKAQVKTLRRIERALEWADLAANEILAGAAEPRLRDDDAEGRAKTRKVWYAEGAQVLEALAYTSPEEHAQIMAILDAARRREQGHTRPN